MFPLLTIVAALSRILPHPMNVTPIAALGLFAGACGSRRGAWIIPVLALLASDAFTGFYIPLIMASVYASFAATALIGYRFLREHRTPQRVILCSLGSSVLFFALSNLACWIAGMYPHTLAGLGTCYVMAVPYFRNTLLGDLFYAAALFGLFELVQRQVAARQAVREA